MILYINACCRTSSRTARLAERLISRLNDSVSEVRTGELHFPVMDEAFLNRRDSAVAAQDFSDPLFALGKEFSAADTIVIAAPFWDLSFPASLKQYFEQINIPHVTFYYDDQGVPRGLCKAKKLFYVTTAGGHYVPDEYGFGYVKALAQNYYGIQDIRQIKAVGLDIREADVNAIMRDAEDALSEMDPD